MKHSHLKSDYALLLCSKTFKLVLLVSLLIAASSASGVADYLPEFMKSRNMSPFVIITSLSRVIPFYLILISKPFITNAAYNDNNAEELPEGYFKHYYIRKLLVMISVMFFILISSSIIYSLFSLYTKENSADFRYDAYIVKFIIFFLVSSVHYVAYTSLITMFSFFKRMYGVFTFALYMLLEIMARTTSINQQINMLYAIARQLPGNFLLLNDEYVVADRIISVDYILSVIPSIILIIFSTVTGITVFRMMYKDQKEKQINNKQALSILPLAVIFIVSSFLTYGSYKSHRLDTFSGYKAISRNYGWYVDQRDTGKNADNNCVPSCGAMVLKWADSGIDYLDDVNELKYEITPDYQGKGWEIRYIKSAMDKYDVNNFMLSNVSIDMMEAELDKGNILVVNLRYPAQQQDDSDTYHVVVIKGYEVRPDSAVYFHVYDPGSWPNNRLMGFSDTIVPADEIYDFLVTTGIDAKNSIYVVCK